jgi:hypothetical protein
MSSLTVHDFPPPLIIRYSAIANPSSSKLILGDFVPRNPSFFKLIELLLKRPGPTSVKQSNSYFLGEPDGVLSSVDDIASNLASRTIWAAVESLRTRLGDFLVLFFEKRDKFPLEKHGAALQEIFVNADIFLVSSRPMARSSSHADQISSFQVFLSRFYIGRRPAYLAIECLYACAQGLHQLSYTRMFGHNAVDPSWYLDQTQVSHILVSHIPSP